jgi:hypothetical protein
LSPLARDIVIVLVVKAIALGALWLVFFRSPAGEQPASDPRQVERHVLAPEPSRANARR